MQHAESSLFIGAVCGRIMREGPSVPILTIHDSLLTTPQYVDYAESVIREEFDKLGVSPRLKEEDYGPGTMKSAESPSTGAGISAARSIPLTGA